MARYDTILIYVLHGLQRRLTSHQIAWRILAFISNKEADYIGKEALEKMKDQISSLTNKRNIKEIMFHELAGKLRSKDDFFAYLDKHCK